MLHKISYDRYTFPVSISPILYRYHHRVRDRRTRARVRTKDFWALRTRIRTRTRLRTHVSADLCTECCSVNLVDMRTPNLGIDHSKIITIFLTVSPISNLIEYPTHINTVRITGATTSTDSSSYEWSHVFFFLKICILSDILIRLTTVGRPFIVTVQ